MRAHDNRQPTVDNRESSKSIDLSFLLIIVHAKQFVICMRDIYYCANDNWLLFVLLIFALVNNKLTIDWFINYMDT